MMEAGGAEVAVAALRAHLSDVRVCKAGCAALIRIVQRGDKCAAAVADAGGTSVMVAAMQAHPQNVDVQNVVAATLSRIMESGAVSPQD